MLQIRILLQLINFRRQDEIIFGKTAGGVSRKLDSHFAVGQINIRMVAFLLGYHADAVGEFQRLLEIGKLEILFQLLSAHHLPFAVQLILHLPQRIAGERSGAFFARPAFLFGEFRFHGWFGSLLLSAKHFGDDENQNRTAQAAAQQQVEQRPPNRGKHRNDDYGTHFGNRLKFTICRAATGSRE